MPFQYRMGMCRGKSFLELFLKDIYGNVVGCGGALGFRMCVVVLYS